MLAASPRAGGNCDTAARLFREGFGKGRGGPDCEISFLRSHAVLPCQACGACEAGNACEAGSRPETDFACPLVAKDDSAPLLRLLEGAPGLCLVAPIYFYHLPAALKALLDRLQCFWERRKAGICADRPPRLCRVILLAGRPTGDKLFAGSLLTLKYALEPLAIRLAEPLLLRGLDAPPDLAANPELRRAVIAYGEEAGRGFRTVCD